MNKKNLAVSTSLCIVILTTFIGHAQKSSSLVYPQVGKQCPDFEFTDVRHFEKKEVRLSDFRGKWLVLDFWHRYCYYCLQSQPHIDSLQRKFGERVQFLLVGYSGSKYRDRSDYKEIVSLYERNRIAYNLVLPIAYDSVVSEKFDIGPTPYIVVIDPQGLVRAITYKISEQNIVDLLSDKNVDVPRAYRRAEAKEKNKKD
ncbi:TlpA family protein disulfide reductase [Niabella sp. CJ426]|uniref:TlpA family protein disulfide reductase n=1 Tax=Niabella sp. CJ426 TaxID=3393740 RepID=UPI003D025888